MKRDNKQKSFTLIELLVATTIFGIVASIAFGAAASLVQHQTEIITTQNIMSNSSYAIEYMERSLRMAHRDDNGSCVDQADTNYRLITVDHIRFLDYQDHCHEFLLENGQIKEGVSSDNTDASLGTPVALTSGNLQVGDLSFVITGDINYRQPRVTTSFRIEDPNVGTGLFLQSTASQRNLNF